MTSSIDFGFHEYGTRPFSNGLVLQIWEHIHSRLPAHFRSAKEYDPAISYPGIRYDLTSIPDEELVHIADILIEYWASISANTDDHSRSLATVVSYLFAEVTSVLRKKGVE